MNEPEEEGGNRMTDAEMFLLILKSIVGANM
jgi:hypothetical protein